MISDFSSVLSATFGQTIPHPDLTLIRELKRIHPNSQIVATTEGRDTTFPILEYLESINIRAEIVKSDSHASFEYDSSKEFRKVLPMIIAGITTFTYVQTNFHAYKVMWNYAMSMHFFYAFVFEADDDSLGRQLASEVYKWAEKLKEEIWVYEEGRWAKNEDMFRAIRAASWDDVVLHPSFKEGIRRDTETFFNSQEIYRSLGITWKRGILLLGPPGNGKTESIKALLNEFPNAALYVKSFSTPYGPEYGVRGIFEKARKHAPCILVLEDLDSMVTDEVRSFFLNEMDGLAQNEGILTIATSNHPERIDDAILNRPSRFDVKYDYTLPDFELRQAFASKWIRKIGGLGSIAGGGSGVTFTNSSADLVKKLAEKTEGWTFAFLKELFISFLLRIAHDSSLRKRENCSHIEQHSPDDVLMDQVDKLSAQILHVRKEEEGKDFKPAKVEGLGRWLPPFLDTPSRGRSAQAF
ncbi:unnamed protein product [Somion occarium]|uniref:AAA+ ATPase domain-containing protein n=1 Tax=Somion occarium TaxID=3059160 RepID=A0ABP1D6F2_9APHY